MQIDLTKLLSQDGNSLKYDIHMEQKEMVVQNEKFPLCEKEPLVLTITNSGKGVLQIHAAVRMQALIPCARCLREVSYDFPLDFEREVDMKLDTEERNTSEEEYNFIEGNSLNADCLVQNELLINWPIQVLCREDCKGICSRCGANLNEGDCGCDRESSDPRMAAVKDIFSKFKEEV